jgi:hypothetical protein
VFFDIGILVEAGQGSPCRVAVKPKRDCAVFEGDHRGSRRIRSEQLGVGQSSQLLAWMPHERCEKEIIGNTIDPLGKPSFEVKPVLFQVRAFDVGKSACEMGVLAQPVIDIYGVQASTVR